METTGAPSILIVDDMPVNLQVLSALLEGEKYRIHTATNGTRALSLAENGGFDLILLDIVMPGMSGFEVCKKLKLSSATRDIPVIFITAMNESDDIVTGFDCGAVDYITKPFNKSELLARVKTHLELRRSREEISRAYAELQQKDAIISDDLRKAREIQQSVIAFNGKELEGIDAGVLFRPMIEVGGDIFDIYRRGDGLYRLFMADATGHGIQAALVTMLIRGEYDKIKSVLPSPGQILENLNRSFFERYYRLSVLFTACIADIDLKNDRVILANAGHPYPYFISAGALFRSEEHGPILGIREDSTYPDAEHSFLSGEALVLYSDGIHEDLFRQRGSMDIGPVENLFRKRAADKPSDFVEGVVSDVLASIDAGEFSDDVTLIMARRT